MAKEVTIESLQAEKTALTQQLTELISANAEQVAALEAEIADLKAELLAAQSDNSVFTKAVPGKYKSKEHKKTVRFKKGYLKTRVNGVLMDSAEIIANPEKYASFLDNLIKIGYAGLEEVEK